MMQLGFGLSIAQYRPAGAVSVPDPVISYDSLNGYGGSVLTAANPGSGGAWQSSSDGTTGWANISGATASTFTMTAALEGKYIRYFRAADSVASNVIRKWVPADLSPARLYRADMGDTVTLNGATVSAWANLGSAGGSLSQATPAYQPGYNTSPINGKPTLRFTATLNGLVDSVSMTTGNHSFAVIGRRTVAATDTNNAAMFAISGGSTLIVPIGTYGSTSTEWIRGMTSAVWYRNGAVVTPATRAAAQVAMNTGATATVLHELDCTAVSVASPIVFGGFPTSAYPMLMDVAEFIDVPALLTAAQRTALNTYAVEKYGVALAA